MGDYAKALGAKLRGIRQQQGLSLHGVEQKSGGRWKAVVVGSYERGDRAVTVQKLAELADFYGVPVVELLPEGRVPSGAEPATKIVINLERLQQLPEGKANRILVTTSDGELIGLLRRADAERILEELHAQHADHAEHERHAA